MKIIPIYNKILSVWSVDSYNISSLDGYAEEDENTLNNLLRLK